MEPLIFVIGVVVGSAAHQKGLRVGDQVGIYFCVCMCVCVCVLSLCVCLCMHVV